MAERCGECGGIGGAHFTYCVVPLKEREAANASAQFRAVDQFGSKSVNSIPEGQTIERLEALGVVHDAFQLVRRGVDTHISRNSTQREAKIEALKKLEEAEFWTSKMFR